MVAGSDLRRDREAQDLLVHSLALPLWRPPETQQHWAVRCVAAASFCVPLRVYVWLWLWLHGSMAAYPAGFPAAGLTGG